MSRAVAGSVMGVLFLAVGLALVGVVVLPVLPAPHSAHVALTPLLVGVGLAVFGALLVDATETRTALTVIVTTAAPYLPWSRRKDDPAPPAAPPGATP